MDMSDSNPKDIPNSVPAEAEDLQPKDSPVIEKDKNPVFPEPANSITLPDKSDAHTNKQLDSTSANEKNTTDLADTESVANVKPQNNVSKTVESVKKETSQVQPQQAKASYSPWTSILKRAVANVESTLDKVIQETSTSELGANESKLETSESKSTKPVPNGSGNQTPIRATPSPTPSGRLTMEQRLAMAVKKQAAATSSNPSSARQSLDVASCTSFDSISSAASTSNATQEEPEEVAKVVEPKETYESTIEDIKKQVESLETPEQKDAILALVEKLTSFNIASSKSSPDSNEELESYKEKVTSLESKLIFLSREEAERAKNVRLNSSGLQKKLAEKEEQIALLMEEGQSLSKKELKHLTTIKNLRARERENERLVEDAKERQHKAEKEVSQMKEKMKVVKELEKQQYENRRTVNKLENEIDSLKKEKQNLLNKVDNLQNTITRLKEKNDEAVLASQTAALNEEKKRSADLQRELSKVQVELTVTTEKYKIEIQELDSRYTKESTAWKALESKLRNDIVALEAKVEMYRSKSEELSSATNSDVLSGKIDGPTGSKESQVALLRQVEILQSQLTVATENRNGIESNLQARISNLEQQLEDANNRETYFKRKIKSLNENLKVQVVENETVAEQLAESHMETKSLRQKVEQLSKDLENLRQEATNAQAQFDKQSEELKSEIAKLKKELQASMDQYTQANIQKQQLEVQKQQLQQQVWKNSAIMSPTMHSSSSPMFRANSMSSLYDQSPSPFDMASLSSKRPSVVSEDPQEETEQQQQQQSPNKSGSTSPVSLRIQTGNNGEFGGFSRDPLMEIESDEVVYPTGLALKSPISTNNDNSRKTSMSIKTSGGPYYDNNNEDLPMPIPPYSGVGSSNMSSFGENGNIMQTPTAQTFGNNGRHFSSSSFNSFGTGSSGSAQQYSNNQNQNQHNHRHHNSNNSIGDIDDSVSTIGGASNNNNNNGTSIQLVSKMARTVRTLESELFGVKMELGKATQREEESTKEVLRLVKENEQLTKYKEEADELKRKVEELEKREQTTLEMLGEKSERVEELRADVEDLKAMYRTQIEDLIDQLSKSKK